MRFVDLIENTIAFDMGRVVRDIMTAWEYEEMEEMRLNALEDFVSIYHDGMNDDGMNVYSVAGIISKLAASPKWQAIYDKWIINHLETIILEIYNNTISRADTSNSTIIIYRSIQSNDSWYPNDWMKQPLGSFWSYNITGAGSYDANNAGDTDWLITAEANLSDIDWGFVVSNQIEFPSEMEIYINNGATVIVKSVMHRTVDGNSNNYDDYEDEDEYGNYIDYEDTWNDISDFKPARHTV